MGEMNSSLTENRRQRFMGETDRYQRPCEKQVGQISQCNGPSIGVTGHRVEVIEAGHHLGGEPGQVDVERIGNGEPRTEVDNGSQVAMTIFAARGRNRGWRRRCLPEPCPVVLACCAVGGVIDPGSVRIGHCRGVTTGIHTVDTRNLQVQADFQSTLLGGQRRWMRSAGWPPRRPPTRRCRCRCGFRR